MADYTDDFSSGTQGEDVGYPPWLQETALSLVYLDETAAAQGSGGPPYFAAALYDAPLSDADHYCQVTLATPAVDGEATVYVRYTDQTQHYSLTYDGNVLGVSSMVGGVPQLLDSAVVGALAPNATIRLEVTGSDLVGLVNGVPVLTLNDTQIADGPYLAIAALSNEEAPSYYGLESFLGGPAPEPEPESNLSTVMDQLGVALGTIAGLRVFDFPPKSAQPPFAFVDMPERIDFDLTYARGADRATFTVVVAVADVVDRAARDAIARYAAGSGSTSVKAAIDAAEVGQSARVTGCQFRPVALAAGTYAGCIFEVDVVLSP